MADINVEATTDRILKLRFEERSKVYNTLFSEACAVDYDYTENSFDTHKSDVISLREHIYELLVLISLYQNRIRNVLELVEEVNG